MTPPPFDELFDRILVAAALVRGFVSEADLAVALHDRRLGIGQHLVRRGRLTSGELSAFAKRLRQRLDESAGADSLSNRLIDEALATVSDLTVKAYLSGEAPPPGRRASVAYELREVCGQGGIGRVWRASDVALGRDVALKEMRPETAESADLCRKFSSEARITSRLQHPNIVPILQFGHSDGHGAGGGEFYTMPLLRGRTLQDEIRDLHADPSQRRPDRLKLRRLLDIFLDVCNAVGFAHSQNVVHRDLKPANIMVGDFGRVFVLDWGLAKEQRQPTDANGDTAFSRDGAIEETRAGAVMGSPMYMAPEQALGRADAVGPAADIFALGEILFEILTGRPPRRLQEGETVERFLLRIGQEPGVPPRQVASWTPRSLDLVCQKAMALDPQARYQFTNELADDVRRWMADETVSVAPDRFFQRIARWSRRHQQLAKGIAGGLLLAVVATASLATFVFLDAARQIVARGIVLEAKAAEIEDHLQNDLEEWSNDVSFLLKRVPPQKDFANPGSGESARAGLFRSMLADFLETRPGLRAILVFAGGKREHVIGLVQHGDKIEVAGDQLLKNPEVDSLVPKSIADHKTAHVGHLFHLDAPHGRQLLLPIARGKASPGGDNDCVVVLLVDVGNYFADVAETTKSLFLMVDVLGHGAKRMLRANGDRATILPSPDDRELQRSVVFDKTLDSDDPIVRWFGRQGGLWVGRRVDLPDGRFVSILVSYDYERVMNDVWLASEVSVVVGAATFLLVCLIFFLFVLMVRTGADG